jgi:broad specificity phosphatase PhoE
MVKQTSANNFCTIYIVRHGQSEGNTPDVYGLDTNLTELGKQQAKDIAQKLKTHHFDAIYSSPLVRAKETAETIAAEHNLAVVTKEALKERYSGVIEGRKVAEVDEELGDLLAKRHELPYEQWKKMTIAQGRETDEQIMGRFITAIREIAVAHPNQTVLIGSHKGLMRTFLVHLGEFTYKELLKYTFENTAYIKLRTDGIDFFIDELHGVTEKVEKSSE